MVRGNQHKIPPCCGMLQHPAFCCSMHHAEHFRLLTISEGIGGHLRLTDAQNQENVGILYGMLCAVWLSTKGGM